jgi:hypothetical protein
LATQDQNEWGRVDETGTVFVREATGERAVGQYPDGTPDEALAYFTRKYHELAGQVTLLEQRVKNGAPAADVSKTIGTLRGSIVSANAVGDLAALSARVDALSGSVTELSEKQSEEAKVALGEAIATRTALVVEAEALASADPAKAQWKQVTAQIEGIFARWKAHQADGPRLPKAEANDLWKRFRAARGTIDTHRRAFFAELDTAHKQARAEKQTLVDEAEALVSQGIDGIPNYRLLLDRWKAAGRAGKKFDDALWAKFKQAGDVLYAAKSEVDAQDDVEFTANWALKKALLDEAEPLLTATDRAQAKKALLSIQKRWDEVGKVPRDRIKVAEERLRKIEAAVRKLDEDHWNTSNTERQERSEGFLGQLNDAIGKLEAELVAAKDTGDAKKIAAAHDALDARKAWLGALK